MAKDPAFLFYSQDFIVGVQTMNFEDRGKYITILAQMHQQGRMSEETISFLVGSVSVNLKLKFAIDKDGLWYSVRLEEESEKRSKFTESRRENGSKGGRPKGKRTKKKPKQNHMPNHMGNENDNVNYSSLLNMVNEITGKKLKTITDKTKGQINARIKDGYTIDDFRKATDNCFKDDFHKENPKYLTLEFISRADKFETYVNVATVKHVSPFDYMPRN